MKYRIEQILRLSFIQALLCIIGIATILSACSPDAQSGSAPPAENGVELLPGLLPFYQELGGEQVLGAPISSEFIIDGAKCQYTVNALVCRDPALEKRGGFFLASIGKQLHPAAAAGQALPEESLDLNNGFTIENSFLDIYRDLGGEGTAGLPISDTLTVEESGIMAQYFERVGFYKKIHDPAGKIRLLPYGAQACGYSCAPSVKNVIGDTVIYTPFEKLLQAISGSAGAFGTPLTEPYLVDDQNIQQVYSKILVSAAVDHMDEIYLRPLPVMLGLPAAPPTKQLYGTDENMIFYPVAGNLGYHIPVFFKEFIDKHGGMQLSGQPIAEPIVVYEEDLARQCFENYCLDYHLGLEAGDAVSLASLGKIYLEKVDLKGSLPYLPPRDDYTLQVGEFKAHVSAEDIQVIYGLVFDGKTDHPEAGMEIRLTVTQPDNSQVEYLSPPTDNNGFASVEVAPVPGAENGSLIHYQACLNIPMEKSVCSADSYMIWSIP